MHITHISIDFLRYIYYTLLERKVRIMAKVSTNINLDPTLKKNAQELLKDLGMDLTTAVTIFLRQTVREQAIPFQIKRDVFNSETVAALEEYSEMKEHPDKYKRYSSFSDAMSEVLNA